MTQFGMFPTPIFPILVQNFVNKYEIMLLTTMCIWMKQRYLGKVDT